jgi:hypothetical protein
MKINSIQNSYRTNTYKSIFKDSKVKNMKEKSNNNKLNVSINKNSIVYKLLNKDISLKPSPTFIKGNNLDNSY